MNALAKTGLLCGLAVVGVLGVGGWLIVEVPRQKARADEKAAHDWDAAEIAKAQKIGLPLEVSDVQRATVPPNKNAAEIYRKILALKVGSSHNEIGYALRSDASPEKIRVGEQALVKLKPLFDLVSLLDSRPLCDFGNDWSDVGKISNFVDLSELKALVRDLCFRADREDYRGDWRAGLKSLAYANRVAVDLGSSPSIIASLMEVAGLAIVRREFQTLCQRHSKDEAFLAAAEAQFRVESTLPDIRRHLAGEIVKARRSLRFVNSRKDLNELATVLRQEDDSHPSSASTGVGSGVPTSAVPDTLDARFLQAWLPTWPRLPKDPQDWQGYYRALKSADDDVQKDRSVWNAQNRAAFANYRTYNEVIGVVQARNRLLLTSIELLKIRAKTGQLPAVLPSDLGPIGIDPFDGKPLRYRRTATGFILYSIGQDRVDNGGRVRKSSDADGTGYDEVMQFP